MEKKLKTAKKTSGKLKEAAGGNGQGAKRGTAEKESNNGSEGRPNVNGSSKMRKITQKRTR